MDLDMTPCPLALGHGLCASTRLQADLSRFTDDLLYMPRSWTPVVPLPKGAGIAFASSYWLGHHGKIVCRGSIPFTLVALRPAQPLCTLRGPPRGGAARNTRCRALMVTRAGLKLGIAPNLHLLIVSNLVTHIGRKLPEFSHCRLPAVALSFRRTNRRPPTAAGGGLRPWQRAFCQAVTPG